MTPTYSCPSLLELEALRVDPSGEPDLESHVASCRRCQALLAELRDTAPAPERVDEPTRPAASTPTLRTGTTRLRAATTQIRCGALWQASAEPDAHFAWIVAIIHCQPDFLLVTPVASADPALATGDDIVLDSTVLGYPAFLDLTNHGTVRRDQLHEPVGELDEETAEAMVATHAHLTGTGPETSQGRRGVPVLDQRDFRLLARAKRGEALQALWRSAASAPSGKVVVLSQLLGTAFDDDDGGWDRPTLLEASRAEAKHLRAFMDDHLDLTDKRDIDDLARVLHTLNVPWQEAQPAIRATLQLSGGGSRQADAPGLPMAARSHAGADPETTTRDLYADQSRIDATARAREREIGIYLSELERALDDLD